MIDIKKEMTIKGINKHPVNYMLRTEIKKKETHTHTKERETERDRETVNLYRN